MSGESRPSRTAPTRSATAPACKVVKNKVSPPFKQAEFDILYGKGISKEGSLIDMGVEHGFIRKSGSWFTYEGEQLGQGKENARNFLIENADMANEIEKKIKEKLGIGAVVTPMTKSCPPPSTSKSAELSREEQARALCLRLLTARARTRAELAGQLTKRGYPDDVSAQVLDRLAEVGLVDDADFAEQWVRSRRVNAGKGKRALAAELRTKGVDNEVITAALADIDAGAERERAEQLVRDKLRRERLGDDDDAKVVRRLVGMLARRGYSQTMAFDVVKAAAGQRAGAPQGLARGEVGRQADRSPLLLVAGRALQLGGDVVDGVGAKLDSLGQLVVRGQVDDDLGGLHRVAVLAVVGVGGPVAGRAGRRRVVVESCLTTERLLPSRKFVRNGPGSMATDLMPSGASSWVMASDSASTANLVAAYTPQPGHATKPPTDDRFTTRPDRAARMCGRTARVTASRPNTLTSKIARASASEVSSTAPTRPRPALLTSDIDAAEALDRGVHRMCDLLGRADVSPTASNRSHRQGSRPAPSAGCGQSRPRCHRGQRFARDLSPKPRTLR